MPFSPSVGGTGREGGREGQQWRSAGSAASGQAAGRGWLSAGGAGCVGPGQQPPQLRTACDSVANGADVGAAEAAGLALPPRVNGQHGRAVGLAPVGVWGWVGGGAVSRRAGNGQVAGPGPAPAPAPARRPTHRHPSAHFFMQALTRLPSGTVPKK